MFYISSQGFRIVLYSAAAQFPHKSIIVKFKMDMESGHVPVII